MKALRWLFLGMLVTGCATVSLLAAAITLQWENPTTEQWDRVRIYRTDGTAYWLVTDVAGTATQCTFEASAGEWTYIARSLVGAQESDNSNTVVVRVKPNSPQNVRRK